MKVNKRGIQLYRLHYTEWTQFTDKRNECSSAFLNTVR